MTTGSPLSRARSAATRAAAIDSVFTPTAPALGAAGSMWRSTSRSASPAASAAASRSKMRNDGSPAARTCDSNAAEAARGTRTDSPSACRPSPWPSQLALASRSEPSSSRPAAR